MENVMSNRVDYKVTFMNDDDIYLDVMGRIDEKDARKLHETPYTNNVYVQAKSIKDDAVVGKMSLRIMHGAVRVEHISVKQEYMGRGVGTMMMSYLEYFTIDHNLHKIFGDLSEESREFYTKLGYEIKPDDAFYLSPTHDFKVDVPLDKGDIFYKCIDEQNDGNLVKCDFMVKDLQSKKTIEDFYNDPTM